MIGRAGNAIKSIRHFSATNTSTIQLRRLPIMGSYVYTVPHICWAKGINGLCQCDKVVEVGLWLPITQARICNNMDPLWCLLRQFTSRGKISTEWKFIWEFPDLTAFFTTSPAQYELLLDSGRFWDTLILISQKNLPRHPTFNRRLMADRMEK